MHRLLHIQSQLAPTKTRNNSSQGSFDMTAMSREQPQDPVIVAFARTPFGSINGQLSSLTASDLGAAAIRGLIFHR
jgi:hypothetical protein